MPNASGRPKPATTPAKEFEARLDATHDWRSVTIRRLREIIRDADPEIVEELKWKKPSNPAGDPVWSHDGIVCVGNTLKASVRLSFPDGASIADPTKLFNSRLESARVRAIDVFEGRSIDAAALRAIVRAAVRLNSS